MAVTSTADLAARSRKYSPDVPIFSYPVASQTISGIVGVPVPIIGRLTAGSALSTVGGAISPVISQATSIASYVANLPPTLFRRPEGPILLGNLVADVAYGQSRVIRNKLLDNGVLKDKYANSLKLNTSDTHTGTKTSPYTNDKLDPVNTGFSNGINVNNIIQNILNPSKGITARGGLLTSTDRNRMHYNDPIDSLGKYTVLAYDQIQARAKRSANGEILPDFRHELVDPTQQLHPTDGTDKNTKNVFASFNYRSKDELHGVSPIKDNEVVDSMMVSEAFDTPDFVKLIFTDRRIDTSYQFRSYITNFSDKWSPEFNAVNYIGRPNALKLFNATSRELSLEFLVPALSRGEMKFMYKKLKALASLTMPTGVGVMTGPIMGFTLGDWVEDETCHLTSLSFDIEPDYSWEVNLEGGFVELPHVIKVSMGIYIIGNTVMNTDSYQIFGSKVNDKMGIVSAIPSAASTNIAPTNIPDPFTSNRIISPNRI